MSITNTNDASNSLGIRVIVILYVELDKEILFCTRMHNCTSTEKLITKFVTFKSCKGLGNIGFNCLLA